MTKINFLEVGAAMGAEFDTYELVKLGYDLTEAAGVAAAETRLVVRKGALNIKTDARRRITGLKHAPRYPYAITYDTHELPAGATAEIGPDKDRQQGALGNVLEFGTKWNPPHPHMGPAGDAEAPRFAAAMEALAVKAVDL